MIISRNEVTTGWGTEGGVDGVGSYGIHRTWHYVYPKPSLSLSNIPTTGNVSTTNPVDITAENRPYNFNIRMYLKL